MCRSVGRRNLLCVLLMILSICCDGIKSTQRCSKQLPGDLIKSMVHNYDYYVKPNADSKTTVFIELHIQDIADLSGANSDFETEFFFSEIWYDNRLNYTRFNLCRNNITLKQESFEESVWTPYICVTNSKRNQVLSSPSENAFLILYENGTLWRNHRMKVRAPCMMDLAAYPFDSMRCFLQFESYTFNSWEVDLRWLPYDPVTYMGSTHLPDWTLAGWNTSKSATLFEDEHWDRLVLTLHFRRHKTYYFLQMYAPTALTVVVSWITFFLDERSTGARITIGVSALLTLSYQFGSVGGNLARGSQLKSSDVWMLICISFVFLSLVELAFVSRIARWQRRSNLRHIAVAALTGNRLTATAKATTNAPDQSGIIGRIISGYKKTFVTKETAESSNIDAPQAQPSTSAQNRRPAASSPATKYSPRRWLSDMTTDRVDTLCAGAFPSLFLVVNCVYWTYYWNRPERFQQIIFN